MIVAWPLPTAAGVKVTDGTICTLRVRGRRPGLFVAQSTFSRDRRMIVACTLPTATGIMVTHGTVCTLWVRTCGPVIFVAQGTCSRDRRVIVACTVPAPPGIIMAVAAIAAVRMGCAEPVIPMAITAIGQRRGMRKIAVRQVAGRAVSARTGLRSVIGLWLVFLAVAGHSAIAHIATLHKGTAVLILIINGPFTVLPHAKVKADEPGVTDVGGTMGIMAEEAGRAPVFDMRFMLPVKGIGTSDYLVFIVAAPTQGKVSVTGTPFIGRRHVVAVLQERGMGRAVAMVTVRATG